MQQILGAVPPILYKSNQTIEDQSIDLIDKLIKNAIREIRFCRNGRYLLQAGNIHTAGGYTSGIWQIMDGVCGSGIYLNSFMSANEFADLFLHLVKKGQKVPEFIKKREGYVEATYHFEIG